MIYEFQKEPTLPTQGGFFYIVSPNQESYYNEANYISGTAMVKFFDGTAEFWGF